LKLLLLCPIVSEDFKRLSEAQARKVCRQDVVLEVVGIERGPASIESTFETVVAEPFAVEKIMEAEQRGFDAVAITCMCDCGLHSGREQVNIPVTSAFESSVLLASALGLKFSIITVTNALIPLFHRNLRAIGLECNLASIRSVDIPVLNLQDDIGRTREALLGEAKKAVENDGAQVIILGCTGMAGMAQWLRQNINLPVIDGLEAAIKLAEVLVDMRLSQSKLTYPKPPVKEIRGVYKRTVTNV
jgi:allantoin racemase